MQQKQRRKSGRSFSFFNLLYCSSKEINEMLGSSDSHEDEEEEPTPVAAAASSSGPGTGLSGLVMEAAGAVAAADWDRAARLVSALSARASSGGDATERLAYQFARALSARAAGTEEGFRFGLDDMERSYLALNQVTPFIRFAHLTANQAILEAVQGEEAVHVVDLNIMQGVQWPPFMQALAERPGGPPRLLRLTGAGPDLEALRRTGRRLRRFAHTLGLRFEFEPVPAVAPDPDFSPAPGEALAVNCVLHLHRLLFSDPNAERLRAFLVRIRGLEPKVVTLAEREADHNHPGFLDRFTEAFRHYSSVFDSLEATLPPTNRERLMVEQVWLGREIMNIVSQNERHQRFERWTSLMNDCGFASLAPSEFALSQARLLLRLHYPSEGYQLLPENNSFFLGWRNTPLFSVSSWH